MISDPTLTVTCDTCGHEEAFPLAATAGGYDERHLASQMDREGWQGDPNDAAHTCESCADDRAYP